MKLNWNFQRGGDGFLTIKTIHWLGGIFSEVTNWRVNGAMSPILVSLEPKITRGNLWKPKKMVQFCLPLLCWFP